MSVRLKLTAIVATLAFGLSARAESTALPENVREKIVRDIFHSYEVDLEGRYDILTPPPAIVEAIRANAWEAGQLTRFASNKLFLIVRGPHGDVFSMHFRDGHCRSLRGLSPERERALRRLYSEQAFTAPPHEALERELNAQKPDPVVVLESALKAVESQDRFVLDEPTKVRLRANFAKCHEGGLPLAVALRALAGTEHGLEATWAGLWLISRMDAMVFRREDKTLSIPDLDVVDARTFFENVHYAVKARLEFPWGAEVTDRDFLQQVLSPRGTGEPLQRWRRQFFEAMEPEVRGFGKDGGVKAVEFARMLTYDFFQYEGDTTWEDFGALTSLAVHEGRCEDCSNVENMMIRALGLPAIQEFTPWWGHCEGNHAWTNVPGWNNDRRDGAGGVKVFALTWDGPEDVTDKQTAVTRMELPTGAADGTKAELMTFNYGEWRRLCSATVAGGKVAFEKLGHSHEVLLLVRIPGEKDRIVRLRRDGTSALVEEPGESVRGEGFRLVSIPAEFGPLARERNYSLMILTASGWKESGWKRLPTGAIVFPAASGRIFRLDSQDSPGRLFIVEFTPDDAAAAITRF